MSESFCNACLNYGQVYPLEVVRRRMQTIAAAQGGGCGRGGLSMFQRAALDIWRRERLRGFYTGMLPNIVQVWQSGPPYMRLSCWHHTAVHEMLWRSF